MRQGLAVLSVAGLLALFALLPLTAAATDCQFILGFATLKALIDAAEGPDKVGECLENQRFNPENGDALQQTTGGLLVWRKADNWTAFTDGYRTWINGPYGLQARLNTEQFEWEGPATPQASPPPAVEIGAKYTAQCSNGIAVTSPQENSGLVDDCAALLQGRDTLAGSATLNWSADRAITDWDGITVSGSPHRVTELKLDRRQLTGSIPTELGALAKLEWLELAFNTVTGPIPQELAALANLRVMRLHHNRLTGTIPPELGTLANLQQLYLYVNRLSGSIPPELAALTNLRVLRLHHNRLTGPIPLELGVLGNLRQLHLHSNRLTGSIPPQLGTLGNLQNLSLLSNQLTGAIPPELGTLANLQSLGLGFNQLTGSIPSELGTLTKLSWLQLDGNVLTGCLPEVLRDVEYNDLDKLGRPFCGA